MTNVPRLSSAMSESHPELGRLLTSLSALLGPDGESLETHSGFLTVQSEFQQAKKNWLQQHILLEEIKSAAFEAQVDNSRDKQFYESVSEAVSLASLPDVIKCDLDPASHRTLLNLDPGAVTDQLAQMRCPRLAQQLLPVLESRLRSRCAELVEYLAVEEGGEDVREGVRRRQSKATQLQTRLTSLRRERDALFDDYTQMLLKTAQLLERVVEDYRLRGGEQQDTATTEWLVARCDALVLKIRQTELQVLCDTYTADTLQALNVINQHLSRATHTAEAEQRTVQQALTAYESVGSGMDALVRELSLVKEELDNKRWSLQELKRAGDR